MNKITTVIVDDEPLARKGLAIRLSEYTDLDIIGECINGSDAAAKIPQWQPDLVFLDIQMPGMNGFELLQFLHNKQHKIPVIVFVTAFDSYAIKAFEVHAMDYVLKPVDDDRLMSAVNKVVHYFSAQQQQLYKDKLAHLVAGITGDSCEDILRHLAQGTPIRISQFADTLAIKDGSEVTRVAMKDIKWIDAAGDYMCVHSSIGTHIMRSTMKELENELDPRLFVRAHRSAIVNINEVSKMVSRISGEYHLILQNGTEIKVSRSHRDQVKALIGV
ncbi:LytTR family DNA-binding domain-containing protein [Alteromonadaceae bacterium BrNp21-10]|nr:LytTR family DNA-binding domain-containing protein [Alteromonadaceae bacterium BrNp21-10]